ncbi:NAD(P)/FAD-dependent oxidoreductase [Streptomyces sp. NPDC057199]|uniref:NAD(P)/FAD-dependent oxidoreductase n=1 Tax=Streptomyces sp. NPDC057199 TaxID=3346047 RepID=UPI003643544B
MNDSVVIVGASLAGLRAAGTLRERGFAGPLVIVGEESEVPYDRPPLSKELLAGSVQETDIALRIPADLEAEWLLGRRATGLDLDRRVVSIDSGTQIPFGGLVIATGVRPRMLPGWTADGTTVFTLRTLSDAFALRTALERRPRLLIVGAGFIGVEVATTARGLGCEVTMVTADPPVAVAGREISEVCDRLLAELGVRRVVGVPITGREGGSVVLGDGSRVEFDAVLVAIGSVPNVEWLAGSGLTLDDGVLCDASCAAVGADRVVAAGDVARWPNPVFDYTPMRIEHWSNAIEQGTAAARTLLEGSNPETECASVPAFWSNHGGARLQSVGLPGMADRVELVAGDPAEARFAVAAYRGDELVGALAYGMPKALIPYRVTLGKRGQNPAAKAVPGAGATG